MRIERPICKYKTAAEYIKHKAESIGLGLGVIPSNVNLLKLLSEQHVGMVRVTAPGLVSGKPQNVMWWLDHDWTVLDGQVGDEQVDPCAAKCTEITVLFNEIYSFKVDLNEEGKIIYLKTCSKEREHKVTASYYLHLMGIYEDMPGEGGAEGADTE